MPTTQVQADVSPMATEKVGCPSERAALPQALQTTSRHEQHRSSNATFDEDDDDDDSGDESVNSVAYRNLFSVHANPEERGCSDWNERFKSVISLPKNTAHERLKKAVEETAAADSATIEEDL